MAFAPLVDCVLMVVQPTTSFNDVQRALELVPREKLLGFVLNRVESSNNDYHYYRYRYGFHKKTRLMRLLQCSAALSSLSAPSVALQL